MTTEVAQAATIGGHQDPAPTSSPTAAPWDGVLLLEASGRHRQDLRLAHLVLRLWRSGALPLRETAWCHLHRGAAVRAQGQDRGGRLEQPYAAWSQLGDQRPSGDASYSANGWTERAATAGHEQATKPTAARLLLAP